MPWPCGGLEHLVSGLIPTTTSNYVVAETCALHERRPGVKSVRLFREEVLPSVTITDNGALKLVPLVVFCP